MKLWSCVNSNFQFSTDAEHTWRLRKKWSATVLFTFFKPPVASLFLFSIYLLLAVEMNRFISVVEASFLGKRGEFLHVTESVVYATIYWTDSIR